MSFKSLKFSNEQIEKLDGLDIEALEDISALHVQALTHLCQTKVG